MTWNTPISEKIRSVSDSFLECSGPNVNSLFSESAPFSEGIKLSFSRTWGKVAIAIAKPKTKTNMEHTRSGSVWTAPLRTDQVWLYFPEHCSLCIRWITKLAQKSFHVNVGWIVHYFVAWGYDYTVRFIASILLYWWYVIGYNFTTPCIYGSRTPESNVI